MSTTTSYLASLPRQTQCANLGETLSSELVESNLKLKDMLVLAENQFVAYTGIWEGYGKKTARTQFRDLRAEQR